jgi:hypothetical protein
MDSRRTLAIVLLVPFTLLTAYAVAEVGFIGIFAYALASPPGWQLFFDLAIALVLVLVWLVADARKARRNPWPWVVLTLLTGSIGPLLYLAISPSTAKR